MYHSSRSSKLFQWPAIQFAVIGLVTAGAVTVGSTLILVPEAQARGNDYGQCANDLTDLGMDADAAAAACSLAFEPTEVSSCVTSVTSSTDISPESALSACSRDRRPDEVASCVASIHGDLSVADSQTVLTHCHRSLLPERYAECVTGLADSLEFAVDESLSRCIAAGYRPENVAPTYIPMQ
ncbi:MAG: hypothetical protein F6K42_09010 [Leptolyngbya sp. SIO1D8]|nr:hypothetical protein [Leptolyngbya sp. SIO1D8]